MLSIPVEIKNLLKADSVYKNFRVHFPNGERADITNSNIVRESLMFTEGIGSQGEIEFGTCENSCIQFEVFGVEKIKGYKIECSIEVECPSSVEGSEYKEDIQKNVYAIPYGSFIVDSCKKQADMTHRMIVAYSENDISENVISNNEVNLAKMNMYSTGKQDFTQNAECLLYSELPELAFKKLTYSTISELNYRIPVTSRLYTKSSSQMCRIQLIGDRWNSNYIRELVGGQISLTDEQIIDCWNQFVDYLESSDILTAESLQVVKNYSIADNLDMCYPRYLHYCTDTRTSNAIYSIDNIIKENLFVYYPYSSNTSSNDAVHTHVSMMRGFQLLTYNDNEPLTDRYDYLTNDDKLVVFAYSNFSDIRISSKRVKAKTKDGYNLYLPEKYPVGSVQSLVQSICQLRGVLGKPDRYGGYDLISLKDKLTALYPSETLYPSESLYPSANIGLRVNGSYYNELWYDDDYTLMIGKITVVYNDSTENDVRQIDLYCNGFSEDSSPMDYRTIDLSNNEIIKAQKWTAAAITSILNTIATNVTGVSYMPSEITMKGRPDLEAGDVLEVKTTTENILTYVLTRTITGIQNLVDDIAST
jgi:hypothetical protein